MRCGGLSDIQHDLFDLGGELSIPGTMVSERGGAPRRAACALQRRSSRLEFILRADRARLRSRTSVHGVPRRTVLVTLGGRTH
jgi:cob(I)alamin adenosyltransferase